LLSVSKKKTIKMPATKVNLSQMVNLAVGTPEVGAANFNVLHTLLHAMLRQLNIVDVQANLNDFDRDFLSASKARELSVLSDADSGRVMMQKMLSARGPLPCLHQVQVLEGEHPIISSSLRSKLQTFKRN
jgi:Zn-dependent peptidase ImmA (M78 family)